MIDRESEIDALFRTQVFEQLKEMSRITARKTRKQHTKLRRLSEITIKILESEDFDVKKYEGVVESLKRELFEHVDKKRIRKLDSLINEYFRAVKKYNRTGEFDELSARTLEIISETEHFAEEHSTQLDNDISFLCNTLGDEELGDRLLRINHYNKWLLKQRINLVKRLYGKPEQKITLAQTITMLLPLLALPLMPQGALSIGFPFFKFEKGLKKKLGKKGERFKHKFSRKQRIILGAGLILVPLTIASAGLWFVNTAVTALNELGSAVKSLQVIEEAGQYLINKGYFSNVSLKTLKNSTIVSELSNSRTAMYRRMQDLRKLKNNVEKYEQFKEYEFLKDMKANLEVLSDLKAGICFRPVDLRLLGDLNEDGALDETEVLLQNDGTPVFRMLNKFAGKFGLEPFKKFYAATPGSGYSGTKDQESNLELDGFDNVTENVQKHPYEYGEDGVTGEGLEVGNFNIQPEKFRISGDYMIYDGITFFKRKLKGKEDKKILQFSTEEYSSKVVELATLKYNGEKKLEYQGKNYLYTRLLLYDESSFGVIFFDKQGVQKFNVFLDWLEKFIVVYYDTLASAHNQMMENLSVIDANFDEINLALTGLLETSQMIEELKDRLKISGEINAEEIQRMILELEKEFEETGKLLTKVKDALPRVNVESLSQVKKALKETGKRIKDNQGKAIVGIAKAVIGGAVGLPVWYKFFKWFKAETEEEKQKRLEDEQKERREKMGIVRIEELQEDFGDFEEVQREIDLEREYPNHKQLFSELDVALTKMNEIQKAPVSADPRFL